MPQQVGIAEVKTNYVAVSREFYWPRQYDFVRKYIRACEVCQRMKPSPSSRALLQPLPIPAECWQSVSMGLSWFSQGSSQEHWDSCVC